MGIGVRARNRPQRKGAFVVRHRLRVGGLVSGALLLAGVGLLLLTVASVPTWGSIFDEVHGIVGVVVAVIAGASLFAMVLVLIMCAAVRPGNAALCRRVLVLDDHGVWIYDDSGWWLARPALYRWAGPDGGAGVDGMLAYSVRPSERGDGEAPGPVVVPWDYLTLVDSASGTPRAANDRPGAWVPPLVHVRWLTATIEQIVEQARRRRPGLSFVDDRVSPPPGFTGWLLRHRRRMSVTGQVIAFRAARGDPRRG